MVPDFAIFVALGQWFSNLRMYQNHVGVLLLSPIPRVSHSVSLFPSSHMMLMLLESTCLESFIGYKNL